MPCAKTKGIPLFAVSFSAEPQVPHTCNAHADVIHLSIHPSIPNTRQTPGTPEIKSSSMCFVAATPISRQRLTLGVLMLLCSGVVYTHTRVLLLLLLSAVLPSPILPERDGPGAILGPQCAAPGGRGGSGVEQKCLSKTCLPRDRHRIAGRPHRAHCDATKARCVK